MGAYYLAWGIKEALTHLEHGLPNTVYMTEKINKALDEFGMPSIHDEERGYLFNEDDTVECENTNMMEARYDLDWPKEYSLKIRNSFKYMLWH